MKLQIVLINGQTKVEREIDRHYLQNLIYGKEMEAEDYKTCALGKFKHDILEYYKVYE